MRRLAFLIVGLRVVGFILAAVIVGFILAAINVLGQQQAPQSKIPEKKTQVWDETQKEQFFKAQARLNATETILERTQEFKDDQAMKIFQAAIENYH